MRGLSELVARIRAALSFRRGASGDSQFDQAPQPASPEKAVVKAAIEAIETTVTTITDVTNVTTVTAQAFENRIQALLKTAQPTQARLLDLLLEHLHDELQLSRVVLMLLSPDKTKLGTRAGKGIEEHSPIRTLVIGLNKTSLFRSLLDKPQALWIEAENYSKFDVSMPKMFKTSFLHDSFFLMPLQVDDKPMGMIICDRAQANTELNKSSYVKFKSAIELTNKALSHLVKRNRQNGA